MKCVRDEGESHGAAFAPGGIRENDENELEGEARWGTRFCSNNP